MNNDDEIELTEFLALLGHARRFQRLEAVFLGLFHGSSLAFSTSPSLSERG